MCATVDCTVVRPSFIYYLLYFFKHDCFARLSFSSIRKKNSKFEIFFYSLKKSYAISYVDVRMVCRLIIFLYLYEWTKVFQLYLFMYFVPFSLTIQKSYKYFSNFEYMSFVVVVSRVYIGGTINYKNNIYKNLLIVKSATQIV